MVITAAISKPTTTQDTEDGQIAEEESNPSFSARSSSPSKVTKAKKPVESGGVSATVCANCGTTTTPLWRRAPNGDTICNACGLYMKARNAVRPHWLKRNTPKKTPCSSESTGTCPGDGHCNGTGGSKSCSGCPAFNQHQINRQSLVCANCSTTTTPLWRRDEAGATICNACGLYYKLHGRHRPVSMKRSVIKRRKRMANGSTNADYRDNTDEEDSEDDKSVSDKSPHSEPPGSPPDSPKKEIRTKKNEVSNNVSTTHRDHHDHDPNSCNHDHCRQNIMKAGHVPALEDFGKPVSKQSDQKRMANKLSGRENEHKPKRKHRRTSEHQNAKDKHIASDDKNMPQRTPVEPQTPRGSDLDAPSNHHSDRSPQPHSTPYPEEKSTPSAPDSSHQSLQMASPLSQSAASPLPPSSSPSLFPPIRDPRSQSPAQLTSSPHVSASSTPPQRPNRHGSHDFTLPPIYEQRPHLPSFSMGSMPPSISHSMSYHTQGYTHPSMQAPMPQPIRYSPNPQPTPAEYYNPGSMNAPAPAPAAQQPANPDKAQESNSSNITKEDLEAHRMELQREVSHLSLLLSKTTAILAGLDQAVTSKEPPRLDHAPNPVVGPPPYWGGANGYQAPQQPYPNYRNQYYPGGETGYPPTYQNGDEYPKREQFRYPPAPASMQSFPQPPYFQPSQPPQQPPYDQRSQQHYSYGNPQLPPLYPPPPSSDSVNQSSQTLRH